MKSHLFTPPLLIGKDKEDLEEVVKGNKCDYIFKMAVFSLTAIYQGSITRTEESH